MANNYAQATVSPSLPTSAFTPLEHEMLRYCGYSGSPDGDNTYFYCEEGDTEIDAEGWQELVFEEVMSDDPSYTKYSSAVVEGAIDAVTLFQGILNKPECSDIPYITIEGANTCDKMRQGEFGGFAVLITRDDVKYMSTSQWLSEACHEEGWKNGPLLPVLPS